MMQARSAASSSTASLYYILTVVGTRIDQRRRYLRQIVAASLAELRSQHLEIYALIRRLYRSDASPNGRSVRLALFADIVARVETHFAAEETLLRNLSHPSYDEQSSAHRQILQVLHDQRSMLCSDAGFSNTELQRALDALLIHSVTDDRAFEQFESPAPAIGRHPLH
jgi:hemerythrin-like metal-binding protein